MLVNGVGYQVFVVGRTDISAPRFPEVSRQGTCDAAALNEYERRASRKFFIHENLAFAAQGPSRHDLFGFETEKERELFRALLKCDGVGPVTAMSAMNIAPPEQFLQAVRLGNVKYIERGVGEKTAQKIILGLGKYAAKQAARPSRIGAAYAGKELAQCAS